MTGAAVPVDAFVPAPTPVTAPFWEAAARGELSMQFCPRCERFYFVPRSFCPRCWSGEVHWRALSGRGWVASFVIVARPTPGVYEHAPYVVAAIELEEGVRMMSNLVDVEPRAGAVALDQAVEVRFVARGELMLPVFAPRASAG